MYVGEIMTREIDKCPKCGKRNINIVKIGSVITVKWGKRTRWKSQDCGHTFYIEKENGNDVKQQSAAQDGTHGQRGKNNRGKKVVV